MKRKLFINGIVDGDTMRDILKVFPNIEDSFRQRKTYDEYYYEDTDVEFDVNTIESLNGLGYGVSIDQTYITID